MDPICHAWQKWRHCLPKMMRQTDYRNINGKMSTLVFHFVGQNEHHDGSLSKLHIHLISTFEKGLWTWLPYCWFDPPLWTLLDKHALFFMIFAIEGSQVWKQTLKISPEVYFIEHNTNIRSTSSEPACVLPCLLCSPYQFKIEAVWVYLVYFLCFLGLKIAFLFVKYSFFISPTLSLLLSKDDSFFKTNLEQSNGI